MMPRQPTSEKWIQSMLKRCQFRQTEVLEDERATVDDNFCPFMLERAFLCNIKLTEVQ